MGYVTLQKKGGWFTSPYKVVAQIVRRTSTGVQLRYIKSVGNLRKNDAARDLLDRIVFLNQDLARDHAAKTGLGRGKKLKAIEGIIKRLFEADQPDAFDTKEVSYVDCAAGRISSLDLHLGSFGGDHLILLE